MDRLIIWLIDCTWFAIHRFLDGFSCSLLVGNIPKMPREWICSVHEEYALVSRYGLRRNCTPPELRYRVGLRFLPAVPGELLLFVRRTVAWCRRVSAAEKVDQKEERWHWNGKLDRHQHQRLPTMSRGMFYFMFLFHFKFFWYFFQIFNFLLHGQL